MVSADGGSTWSPPRRMPVSTPHGPIRLRCGDLLCMGRPFGKWVTLSRPDATLDDSGIPKFSMVQTQSDDGGRTWSAPVPLRFHGSPPHLIRHSSGILILSYGYRQAPLGQRVAFSRDDGATWDHDWILRDDAHGDVGYPATVEMDDGSLFSVYYQQVAPGEKCSILWSRWKMPLF